VIEREREREGGKEAECYFRHVHVLMYPLSISIHTRYIQKRAHTFRENMHILHTHAPIAGTLSRHSKPDTYQYVPRTRKTVVACTHIDTTHARILGALSACTTCHSSSLSRIPFIYKYTYNIHTKTLLHPNKFTRHMHICEHICESTRYPLIPLL